MWWKYPNGATGNNRDIEENDIPDAATIEKIRKAEKKHCQKILCQINRTLAKRTKANNKRYRR